MEVAFSKELIKIFVEGYKKEMGLPKLKADVTVEEYLEREKISPVKHEYVYGEVYAMAGTNDNHNRIAINILTRLSVHL